MKRHTDVAICKKPKRRGDARSLWLFIMLLPALAFAFVFSYLPISGIIIAFKDFSPFLGMAKSPWVGFRFFKEFLTDQQFWMVFKNTMIINLYDIVFGFVAPILFALLVNEVMQKRFKKTIQTISYLPHFLSWVVVAGLYYKMLSPDETGIVNLILMQLFGIEPIYFMSLQHLFIPVVIFSEIWKSVGWSAILYFATLSGIDTSLYEAAYIDGAGRLKQTFHITIPGLLPIIVLMFLLKISNLFSVGFDRMFNMQNPIMLSVSEVISTYVYRMGLLNSQYSLTTAIGLTQSIMGFVLLVTANSISKRISNMGLY